jgi:hypothetical protein
MLLAYPTQPKHINSLKNSIYQNKVIRSEGLIPKFLLLRLFCKKIRLKTRFGLSVIIKYVLNFKGVAVTGAIDLRTRRCKSLNKFVKDCAT